MSTILLVYGVASLLTFMRDRKQALRVADAREVRKMRSTRKIVPAPPIAGPPITMSGKGTAMTGPMGLKVGPPSPRPLEGSSRKQVITGPAYEIPSSPHAMAHSDAQSGPRALSGPRVSFEFSSTRAMELEGPRVSSDMLSQGPPVLRTPSLDKRSVTSVKELSCVLEGPPPAVDESPAVGKKSDAAAQKRPSRGMLIMKGLLRCVWLWRVLLFSSV
jgi:hypothetical protein